MSNEKKTRSERDANSNELASLTMSRRRLLQATGGLGAGSLISTGTLSAQEVINDNESGFEAVSAPSEGLISVLMVGGPEGGSHSAPARQVQITEYLLNRGIEVQYTDRLADLESDTLHRYDAWIMYDNRSGLTQTQEDSIVEFVENGGGFIPIHSASACFTGSDAYISLVGGQFESHGFEEMSTTFEQPNHPILSNLSPIVSKDETYRHTNLNDDINVLAYGDFPDYGENEPLEPWSWTRTQGDGRVFYTAWGHGRGTWEKSGFKKLIENAVRWVTGNEGTIGNDTVLDELEFVDANIPYYPPSEGSLLPTTVPEEVGTGTDWKRMQRALNPEGTIKHTITPENFDLQSFVTEEMLPDNAKGNILDVKFDEQGRAWLAVTRDYPNELGQNRDKIVVCEDTNGDRTADDFTVFAENLSIPASMILVENGVIVANLNDPSESGQMLHITDTNGDDRADERTVLFSGFGNGDTHAGPNELVHGIDNWVWGQVGYSGFNGTVAGEQYDFSSSVYRFKRDEGGVSAFELVGELPGNQAGLGFTEEGLAFGSAATVGRPSNYFPIPYRFYELINGTSPTDFGAASDTNRFLPVTDRVRQVDWHGGYTAATGHTIYTAREYPKKYWNNTGFVGDGTGHVLGTFYLEQDGAGYSTHYSHNLAGGTDAWFAPSYSTVGPDGMLWFIDWYNYIYQHNPTPDGFENGPGNAYVTELRDHATARLFCVTYGDDTSYQQTDLSSASPSALVDALSNDNMFWRRTAQRMLVARGETDVVSDLVGLVTTESIDEIGLDPGTIHALWTLDGLGALDADSGNSSAINAARGALTHSSAGARITALRVVPPTATTRDAILSNDLLNDDDQRVAMWALLTLAETPNTDAAGEAVYQMISTEPNYEDTVLIDAASVAGAQHANGFITAYEANEDTGEQPDPGELPNLFQNPSMEESGSSGPAGWESVTYGGTAEFTYTSDVARTGNDSVRIDSTEGADASWTQFVQLDANAEYRFRAWVRTSDDFHNSTGGGEDGSYGVTLNVHSLGQDSITDNYTEPVDGWQMLETTFTTGGSSAELQLNLLFGGWGNAFGTVWFDDAELKKIGGYGGGLETVYDRVVTHVEQSDGDDDDDDNGGGGNVIDPSITIKLDAFINGWEGTAPDGITSQTNPTLTLQKGAEYTVEWTNADGAPHDIYMLDSQGNEIEGTGTDIVTGEGNTASVTFTATTEMVEYYCSVHPTSMRGTVSVQESGGGGEGPPPIGGSDSPPTDPDGDGLYEDINGDGAVTDADGELFFEQFEDPAIQDNPAAFDFNGNGRLDLDDIVAWHNQRDN